MKKRESRRQRRQRESREARQKEKRERASIGTTKTNLGRLGTSVDSDILTYAMAQAERMGYSSQQAAIRAAQIQQIRNSGKNVKISDDGLGYHTY